METTFERRIDPHGRNDLQGIQYPLPQLRTEFLGGGMVSHLPGCQRLCGMLRYPG